MLAKGGKIIMPVFANRGGEVVRQGRGGSPEFGRQQCDDGHRTQLGALDHGGESAGDHQFGHGVPREVGSVRLRAVTWISICMRGSDRPAAIMVAARAHGSQVFPQDGPTIWKARGIGEDVT